MNRRRPRRRRLDTAVSTEILPRHEVTEVSLRSAVLEAWLCRPSLPAVKIDISQVVEKSVLGLDIDNSRRAQAVLRGQRPGQQADRLGEARTQHLPETGDSFRQLDPVNPVLKIRMVTAHVKLSERVLRNPRRSEERRVGKEC